MTRGPPKTTEKITRAIEPPGTPEIYTTSCRCVGVKYRQVGCIMLLGGHNYVEYSDIEVHTFFTRIHNFSLSLGSFLNYS